MPLSSTCAPEIAAAGGVFDRIGFGRHFVDYWSIGARKMVGEDPPMLAGARARAANSHACVSSIAAGSGEHGKELRAKTCASQEKRRAGHLEAKRRRGDKMTCRVKRRFALRFWMVRRRPQENAGFAAGQQNQ
jgi:hypothetical protein